MYASCLLFEEVSLGKLLFSRVGKFKCKCSVQKCVFFHFTGSFPFHKKWLQSFFTREMMKSFCEKCYK